MELSDHTYLQECRFLILPTRLCPAEYESYHNAAHTLWLSQWERVYKSVKKIERDTLLKSDEFLNAEEIIVIYYDETPIGLALLNWYNLRQKSALNHSYFNMYPDEVKNYIKVNNIQCIQSGTHLTVHPDWRKSSSQEIGELITSLALSQLAQSPADIMITLARNDVKVNQMNYRLGGKPLYEKHNIYGRMSDVIMFPKNDTMNFSSNFIYEIHNKLWQNRIDVANSFINYSLTQKHALRKIGDIIS